MRFFFTLSFMFLYSFISSFLIFIYLLFSFIFVYKIELEKCIFILISFLFLFKAKQTFVKRKERKEKKRENTTNHLSKTLESKYRQKNFFFPFLSHDRKDQVDRKLMVTKKNHICARKMDGLF